MLKFYQISQNQECTRCISSCAPSENKGDKALKNFVDKSEPLLVLS